MVFLSHAGDDTEVAKELARHLRLAGLDVWLDVERLKPGDLWMERLEGSLAQATSMMVYVGRSGVESWVDREVRVALDRSAKDPNFRLIPALGPGADPDRLPLFLRQYQWVDCRRGFPTSEDIKAIVGSIGRQPPRSVSLLPPGMAPFRGLLTFDADHALLFYGRDQETQELLDKLQTDSFLAVVGDSGSGKSSLVRAGLIPALRRGRFQKERCWATSWRIAICRPGDDPFRELAEALPALNPDMTPGQKAEYLGGRRENLLRGVDSLRNCIAALLPAGAHSLLVIDQFEELFTLTANNEQRVLFIDSLLHAARTNKGADRPVHVIITLRADFYSHCWQHPVLPKRIASNQYAVRRMSRPLLQEIIEKPLALSGAEAEPGLVETILDEVGDEPGNLALLEHALLQLWEKCDGRTITHRAYSEIGRLTGALRNYADETYERFRDDNQKQLARKIFLCLTQLGEGAEDTRRRVRKKELLAVNGDSPEADEVLRVLIDARLITTSANVTSEGRDDDKEFVEVAHEALIREWPLLQTWISESRDALRVERRILQSAEEWDSAAYKRDPSMLLQGIRLAQAEDWAREHPDELPLRMKEFLALSFAARDAQLHRETERRQAELETAHRLTQIAEAQAKAEQLAKFEAERSARRMKRFSFGLGLLALTSLSLFQYARKQQSVAESRQLSMQAENQLSTDPSIALDCAIRAAKHAQTDQAQLMLFRALAVQKTAAILMHDDTVNTAMYSQGCTLVVTSSVDKTARIWDASTGRVLCTLRGHEGPVIGAIFSPDGSRVVTASDDETARIWDSRTGRELHTLRGHRGFLNQAVFSPMTGQRVLTASNDGTARIWDAATGLELQSLRPEDGSVYRANFSSDGRYVVTASRQARIWKVDTGQLHLTLPGHTGPVQQALFSDNGLKVLTASDNTARVWDAQTGQMLRTLDHADPVNQAAFSPRDGLQVLTATEDGTVKLWDSDTGTNLHTVEAHKGHIYHAAYAPDGLKILTASDDNTAKVWDSHGGLLVSLVGHLGAVRDAVWAQDSGQVVTASDDHTARIWNLDWGQARVTGRGNAGYVFTALYSSDGKKVVTASADTTVRVWDARTGRESSKFSGPESSATMAMFSPRDDTRVLTSSKDGIARIWDTRREQPLHTLDGGSIFQATYSPDGRTVLTVSKDWIARLWDANGGQPLHKLAGHKGQINQAVYSQDGGWIVTASDDKTARIWNAHDPSAAVVLQGHDQPVVSASFSPDAALAVTASRDGTARIWDARTGRQLKLLKRNDGSVTHAMFSPDGKQVLTADVERKVQLWETTTGALHLTLAGHQNAVTQAVFSHDGSCVLTSAKDGIKIWYLRGGQEPITLTGRSPVRAVFSPDTSQVLVANGDGTWQIYPIRFPELIELAEQRLPTGLAAFRNLRSLPQPSASGR